MPFGLALGQLARVVREARAFEGATGQLAISGPDARELATALAVGGDSAAIAVDGDPLRALVAVRLVEGELSDGERATLRRVVRAGTPIVVVRMSGGDPLPYVLPEDVVEADVGLPVERVAEAIARAAGDTGPVLAAALPLLRRSVVATVVERTAIRNAIAAGFAGGGGHPQLPVLTLAQSRMLLALRSSRGETLPRDPRLLASAAGPAFCAALATGLGARTLVRSLPLRGRVVRTSVAYAGTRMLGTIGLRL